MKNNLAIIESDSVIVSMTRASMALAEAVTIGQTKTLIDVAYAAEIYSKRHHLSDEAIGKATAVKVEATRKLGEILMATPKAAVRMNGKNFDGTKKEPSKKDVPTLEQLGLSKKESAVAQKLAALPEEQFEQVRLGNVTIAKAIAAVDAKPTAQQAPEKPAAQATHIAEEPKDDETVNPVELMEELHKENEALQKQIAILLEENSKAELHKIILQRDHAVRQQNEAQDRAHESQKLAKRLGQQVRDCCQILGIDDPRFLVGTLRKRLEEQEA